VAIQYQCLVAVNVRLFFLTSQPAQTGAVWPDDRFGNWIVCVLELDIPDWMYGGGGMEWNGKKDAERRERCVMCLHGLDRRQSSSVVVSRHRRKRMIVGIDSVSYAVVGVGE
jgi:hypothetical protein